MYESSLILRCGDNNNQEAIIGVLHVPTEDGSHEHVRGDIELADRVIQLCVG